MCVGFIFCDCVGLVVQFCVEVRVYILICGAVSISFIVRLRLCVCIRGCLKIYVDAYYFVLVSVVVCLCVLVTVV